LTKQGNAPHTVLLRTAAETVSPSRLCPSNPGRARRALRVLATSLVVTLGFLVGGGVNPLPDTQPAMAFNIFDPCGNPSSTTLPQAAEWPGMLSMMNPTSASTSISAAKGGPYGDSYQATAYEWYGTAGLSLYNGAWSEIPFEACTLIDTGMGAIGNFIHTINLGLAEIGLLVMGWAVTTDLISTFLVGEGAPVPMLIKSLQDSLYVTYLIPIILLSAAWLGWRGIVKGRGRDAIQGTIWMVGSGIVATLFFVFPTSIATYLNDAVTTVGTTVIGATTGITGPASNTDMCYLPDGAPDRGTRMVQCSLWKTFAYQPWASAQFGSLALKDPVVVGGNEVASTFRDSKSLPLVMLDLKTVNHDQIVTGNRGESKREAQWAAVVTKMTTMDDPDVAAAWPNFTGSNTGGRLSIEIVNLVGMLLSAIPSVFLSLTLIFQQIAFVFLLILAPLFLTIGIHPGAGRRIALGWLEMVLGTAVKRLITYVLLAVMLAMIAAVTASTAGGAGGILVQIILMAAVSFGVLSYRKKIIDQFSTVSLGGQSLSTGEGSQLLRQAGGVLTGAVAGGIGAKLDDDNPDGGVKGAVKGAWQGRRGMSGGQAVSNVRAAVNKKRVGGDEGIALDAERKTLSREDRAMNVNRAGVEEWVSWSQTRGGRAVPRPADAEMAQQLEARGVLLRDQVPNVVPAAAAAAHVAGANVPRPETSQGAAPELSPVSVQASELGAFSQPDGPAPAGASGSPSRPRVEPEVEETFGSPFRSQEPNSVNNTDSTTDWARVQAIRNNTQQGQGGGKTPTRPRRDES
jgi:hypothetical protein